MRRSRRQRGRCSFSAAATAVVATAPWMAALSLSQVWSSLAMDTVFLETDMKAAWIALLDAGSSSSSERHEGAAGAGEGAGAARGSREIVDKMLVDCHGRQNEAWGAECDRALYFDSVLEKIDSSSSNSSFASAADVTITPEETRRQQETLDSAANEVAAVPAGKLPFSTFFHEYAVPRRPVLLLSGKDVVDEIVVDATSTGLAGGDAQGTPPHLNPDPAEFATDTQADKERRLPAHERLLRSLDACLPYPVDPTAASDKVDGPLYACQSMLEDLPVPLHVSEDFAQRFRGRDVLTMEEHPDVERFVSGWHRIHRTRHGADIPATACPAGTNTLVTVLLGTLEVLVYAPADGLACLKQTFGKTSCPNNLSGESSSEKPNKLYDADNDGEKEEKTKQNGGALTGDHALTSPKPNPQALLMEAFGLESKGIHQEPQSPLLDLSRKKLEIAEEAERGGEEGDVRKVADEEGLRNMANGDKDHYSHSLQGILWPHEPRYCADIWRGHDEDEAAVTRENVRVMSAGDSLFVPSGGAVSWRAKEDGEGEDEAVAVRFCYVDASNFNSVKSQLRLYAAVEPGANGLLQAFRSPVFDTSMNRNPSAVSSASFLVGDRHATVSSSVMSTSSASSASFTFKDREDVGIQTDGDGATEAVGGRQGRRRRLSGTDEAASDPAAAGGRVSGSSASSSSGSEFGKKGGRRGRKSFKEWQDDSRWDLKVLGLTLPTLDSPRVRGCERTACTVEWTSSFLTQGQDQTKLGFNVSFVPAVIGDGSLTAGDGRGGGFLEVFVGDSRLKSEHALDRGLLSLGINEGKRHTVVVDSSLVPDTPYRFSVCVVYGETAGPFSEFSKPARTSKITKPLPVPRAPAGSPGAHAVTLHFLPPHDDGGSPVSWYHVMTRPIGENVLSKWQAVGMAAAPAAKTDVSIHDTEPQAVAVRVDHLVPGVAYEFRVCAQNDVGTSPWSSPSDAVVVLAAAADSSTGKDFSLSGFHPGHKHLRLPNVTEVSVSYAGETEPPPGEGFDPFEREVHGPTVVLDDRAGKVRMASNSSTLADIDVWTCHFSPQSFRVKAEVVMARPADAQGELENGRFARNRLVVVERGNTPIVHKVLNAQRAGALGVIVADDGRCGGSFGQLCVHGSDPPEGWAALDMPRPWRGVRVPVVLMLREDAERLTAAAGAAEEEAQSMAWSSLYDGWLNSVGSSSSSSSSSSSVGDRRESSRL